MNLTNFILLVSLFTIFSCNGENNFQVLENGKTIDLRMVGTWEGAEDGNQEEGLQKSWNVDRKNDGTFKMLFTLKSGGQADEVTEIGTWWIEDEKFYEIKRGAIHPDIYRYEFITEDQLKFKAHNLNVEFVNEAYEFIDHRVK